MLDSKVCPLKCDSDPFGSGCDRMSSSWGHFGACRPPQAPFTAHSSVTSIFRSGVAMGKGLQGGGL